MSEAKYIEVFNFTFPYFRVLLVIGILVFINLMWFFLLDKKHVPKLISRVVSFFCIFVLLFFLLGCGALYEKTKYIMNGNYSVVTGLVHVESENYEDIVFSVGSKKFTLFGGDFLMAFSKSEYFDVIDGMCLKVYYNENDILKIFHDESQSCKKS